ncbi:Hypothetical predicted protein [Scomber scombrus]|uniref:Uncharacterized protein n=1 Tax=Scomber scombrus TaxID=13677 RepID=A0AAV1NVF2_SCOSC
MCSCLSVTSGNAGRWVVTWQPREEIFIKLGHKLDLDRTLQIFWNANHSLVGSPQLEAIFNPKTAFIV